MRGTLLLLASAFLVGCSGSLPFGVAGTQALVLVLPQAPPSWSPLGDIEFELSWIDAGGDVMRACVRPGSRIGVELSRGSAQAILARASAAGRSLKPAGALYPVPSEEEPFVLPWSPGGLAELALDWTGGYVASVARRLDEAGPGSALFDLRRLGREVASRVADPWSSLDAAEAARRLAGGAFRARRPARARTLGGRAAGTRALGARKPPSRGAGSFGRLLGKRGLDGIVVRRSPSLPRGRERSLYRGRRPGRRPLRQDPDSSP